MSPHIHFAFEMPDGVLRGYCTQCDWTVDVEYDPNGTYCMGLFPDVDRASDAIREKFREAH